MAGINAALAVQQKPPFTLDRTEAYLGIMVDDLIAKGTDEPYRMFTSRAEFRLHLRIDNADRRLTPHGRALGLVDDAQWSDYEARQNRATNLRQQLEATRLNVNKLSPEASARMEGSLEGLTLADLLKRPETDIRDLLPQLSLDAELFGPWRDSGTMPSVIRNEQRAVETEIKYAGYLAQQLRSMARMRRAEGMKIPAWFDYRQVSGLSHEMQQTFERVRPVTLGQAIKLPGVTPAAVSLLRIYVELRSRERNATSLV
jgi:tRNA uridine 5-carboxymethylaminomethyl modification enzyme